MQTHLETVQADLISINRSFDSDDGQHAVVFEPLIPTPWYVGRDGVLMNTAVVRGVCAAIGARVLYVYTDHSLNPDFPLLVDDTGLLLQEGSDFVFGASSLALCGDETSARIHIDPRFEQAYNKELFGKSSSNKTHALFLSLGFGVAVAHLLDNFRGSLPVGNYKQLRKQANTLFKNPPFVASKVGGK